MKIYIFSIHNNPSGGTKVLNQIVNLFIEKGYQSNLVSLTNNTKKATFLKSPAPVISLNQFRTECTKKDVVIDCWQNKVAYESITNCPSSKKIFWQHGAVAPYYKDFDSDIIYTSKKYDQYWNVSQACADYISNKFKVKNILVVNPYFNDETLSKFTKKTNNHIERKGILCLRQRGREAINDIINNFPTQKITVLNKPFSDEELYSEILKNKFFISFDNGPLGKTLTKNKIKMSIINIRKVISKKLKKSWTNSSTNLLGFPMTACESAWLETNVIGFAMGGGLEWMNDKNMYLAKDDDIDSLLDKIKEAINDTENNLKEKRKKAFEDVSKFNKENTWKQIKDSLNI